MNVDNSNMNDELLVKYLAGEASPEEAASAEQWIQSSKENSRYFEHFKLIWDNTEQAVMSSTVSGDAAWERFEERIKLKKHEPPVRSLTYWIRIAAVLIIGCTAAWFVYHQYQNSPSQVVALNSVDNILIDTLSDGSIITLNKNSSLRYPEKFKGNTRAVVLTGEAFFNIEPDKSRPFVISVNNVKVTVVGTSFNIKSREGKTVVIVETGIVKVAKNADVVELRAGEMAEVDSLSGNLTKDASDSKLYNYYRSREFVCEATPLSELVSVLAEAYNVEIKIENPAVKSLPLTTVFKDQPVEQILAIISETFKIKVDKEGKQFILR
ncbi:FecR domain-containing protein [Desertivirga xinjiangensis]|uniref:FecR domain-containing protein n=1 Tax=Desertivirga xinjiangensis TaxID=539206 RepID=UPI0021092AD6|nr:FecR domain-containing protein [Pedobacter xinjiangensis]